jgi:glycosyltransferase involved in cell wall biosynthesis
VKVGAGYQPTRMPMHILHITTFLQGGAGRIITALALAQRDAGHEVTVATDDGVAPGYGSYPEYLERLSRAGVRVFPVRSTFTRDLALNVGAAAQLRALVDAHPVTVAHTHAAIPALVAHLALAGCRRVPFIHTMHGWGINKTPEQATTDLTLLGTADVVVTPSAAARDALIEQGLRDVPLHVIPYGIDPELPSPVTDPEDIASITSLRSRLVALCIGTIGERKNQALLVKALARNPRVAAVFIGDGDVAALRAAAERAGVADRVRILGYRPDASRYLAHADVLVLPSRNEGLPIAVLEAFRAGVPVVGSDIPEIAEAVEDSSTGALFGAGTANADAAGSLAAALDRLGNPLLRARMGEAARRTFASRYGIEQMLAQYERLYAEGLTGRTDQRFRLVS